MPTYNKITLNGTTLVDLSTDTVAVAGDIASGKIGHLNTGATATGTHSGSANIQSLSVTTNGTYTAGGGVDGYSPVVINVPSSGGGGGSASDAVRFLDYDGTILYSYSAEDFANLSAMPANPSHTGLTAQGWNWTLADAKAQLTAYPDGGLTIGQMYITNDGKTRIYISLFDSTRLSPFLGICPNGTVVVDWGDNTATDTLTGTSLTTVQRVQHTYTSAGDYIITLEVTSGSFQIYGSSNASNGSYLLTRTDGNIISQRCYQNAIQKVELGSNAVIGNYAFHYCTSLASITIPSGVTSIGNYAFQYCYSLISITIPSGVTSISSYAFQYCYSLISITIPSGVRSIVYNAFVGCYSLVSITIPSGVTSIGSTAFQHCVSLASITIPSGVTSISASAFMNCDSLASITIPSGVTSIGSSAFQECRSLASITIPSGVTSISTSAFNTCYSLASITIPSGVTSIGNSAFQYCHSLASITIPSGVTSIGSYAFQSCDSLASIAIPSGVTSIGNSAFYGCNSLSSITIPSGVTSIGSNTFYNCYGVAEYHFLSTTPPTLGSTNAFTGILSDCKIYVPSASLSAYKTATNWSTYASYMVGE